MKNEWCMYICTVLLSEKVTRENAKRDVSYSKSQLVSLSHGSGLAVNLHISALIS